MSDTPTRAGAEAEGYRIEDALEIMSREVNALNTEKGWRDLDSSFAEYVALAHSELSEALDAWRKRKLEPYTTESGKPDDVGAEMADSLIRIIDMCDRFGIDLASEYRRKMDYNWQRPYLHGGKLL